MSFRSIVERTRHLSVNKIELCDSNTRRILIEPMLALWGHNLVDIDAVRENKALNPDDDDIIYADYTIQINERYSLMIKTVPFGHDINTVSIVKSLVDYASHPSSPQWVLSTNGQQWNVYDAPSLSRWNQNNPINSPPLEEAKILDLPDPLMTFDLIKPEAELISLSRTNVRLLNQYTKNRIDLLEKEPHPSLQKQFLNTLRDDLINSIKHLPEYYSWELEDLSPKPLLAPLDQKVCVYGTSVQNPSYPFELTIDNQRFEVRSWSDVFTQFSKIKIVPHKKQFKAFRLLSHPNRFLFHHDPSALKNPKQLDQEFFCDAYPEGSVSFIIDTLIDQLKLSRSCYSIKYYSKKRTNRQKMETTSEDKSSNNSI
ncbi:MAG: hypothetical protein CMK59_00045 [Proteobacteria bacterium]|nr:hypothetical protein [Pseudomonadota bacterium]